MLMFKVRVHFKYMVSVRVAKCLGLGLELGFSLGEGYDHD